MRSPQSPPDPAEDTGNRLNTWTLLGAWGSQGSSPATSGDRSHSQHAQKCSLTLINSALEVKADRPPNSLASFLGTPRTMGICSNRCRSDQHMHASNEMATTIQFRRSSSSKAACWEANTKCTGSCSTSNARELTRVATANSAKVATMAFGAASNCWKMVCPVASSAPRAAMKPAAQRGYF